MKIALCQINPIIGDITGNKQKIIDGYKKSINSGVELVVFPELAVCGYPPQDLVEKQEFREAVKKAADEIASVTGDAAVIFGSITDNLDDIGPDVHNSAIVAMHGKICFEQHKTLLPNYDVFDEVRYFEASSDNKVFIFNGKKIGISICEDIWNDADYWNKRRYYVDPVQKLIKQGAEILINISASPYAFGKRTERMKMLSVISANDKLPIIYTCCAGAQTDLIFDGASMCFDNYGKLCLLGKSFQEDLLFFDTEADYKQIDKCEGKFEEEVLNALIYGLKEYCNKTGFKKAILGLSGGIDSALVAFIAVKALGSQNVHALLMPSQFSSEGSVSDSVQLAKNLNISYDTIPIQPAFEKTLNLLEPFFGNLPFGVAEENLQSRIRGLFLMAFSNKFGYLLCTTGNKSEMAVGYATLYGDMNGALGIIADIYKTQVYQISEYINRDEEIIPRAIIDKAPSAELRPNQTDQDSLPPYELLDKILKMYLEENKEIEEISQIIGEREVVRKVLKLVDFNEFKRKQAAPVLRVSVKAFGYGRRYPIVQGWRK
ncbi:MAG: NAD+ synthase [Ignavibacteria bacterium]|nr:NAD+ synthase [Ignavibacteria bacterium]